MSRETRLNPLDLAWLFTESRATPNHVGGFLIFRLPEGAPRDFLRKLMSEFRSHRTFEAPWDRRLKVLWNEYPAFRPAETSGCPRRGEGPRQFPVSRGTRGSS